MRTTIRNLHKWIGIAIGLVLLLWIGTGVLMVLPHRSTTGAAPGYDWQHAAITPAQAVSLAQGRDAGGLTRVSGLDLHRLADRLVYRVHFEDGSVRLVDAASGGLVVLDSATATVVARTAFGVEGEPVSVERLERYDVRYAAGPLPAIRVAFDDPARTVAYVGVRDGTVRGGGTGHRVRAIISGLHTFYPLRALVGSARIEVGLLLLACAIGIAGIATGYWLALPRRLRARRSG
jgi:uncharacterized iron-regulated membrane protein